MLFILFNGNDSQIPTLIGRDAEARYRCEVKVVHIDEMPELEIDEADQILVYLDKEITDQSSFERYASRERKIVVFMARGINGFERNPNFVLIERPSDFDEILLPFVGCIRSAA